MPTFSVKTDDIPVADFVQAVGSLIAIIAAIYSFIILFKKDKDKQAQIDSLVGLARESTNQTQQLIAQSNHMRKLNDLYEEQLVILRKSSELSALSLSDEAKQRTLESKIRKVKNSPKISYKDVSGNRFNLSFTLINQGERAEIIAINNSMSNIQIRVRGTKKIISNKETLSIDISSQIGADLLSVNYSFTIVYKDIEDNQYEQRLHGPYNALTLEEPVEIPPV